MCCRGVKRNLLYSRVHSVQDSLNHVKLWNSALIFSTDLMEAMTAAMKKQKPHFTGL